MARNLHIKQSYLRAMTRAEDLFAKAKDFVLPDMLFTPPLAPAFAGPAIPSFIRFPERGIPSHTFEFTTHGMQKTGTIARDITDWKYVEVIKPEQKFKPGKSWRFISYKEAQDEVARILNGRAPCHEYIAYEAAKLCGDRAIVAKYTLHLVIGAAAEDLNFAPGESFTDLYAAEPKRSFKSRQELSDSILPSPKKLPSFFQGIFTVASKVWAYLTKKDKEKDDLNRPYFAHFYDPSRKPGDQGLSLLGGDVRFKTAKDRAKMYWHLASQYYVADDMPRTFCALGHLVHLISDMQVPAHTHNDIHGPNVILGKPDSLEGWLARADYQHIARRPNEPNVRIWSGRNVGPLNADHSWDRQNLDRSFDTFMAKLVAEARMFRSVDAKGGHPDEKRTGPLSDEECFKQASVLIPGAIRYSAQIIENFIDYHARGGITRPAGWAPADST